MQEMMEEEVPAEGAPASAVLEMGPAGDNPLAKEVVKEPQSQAQAIRSWTVREALASMPRNTLGLAVVLGLGMMLRLPMPSSQRARIAAQAMREGLAKAEPPAVLDTTDASIHELRDSVTRSEAQTTFEAQMRVKALQNSL